MVRCPACSQMLEVLTSVHCEKVHGMGKAEFCRRYGRPTAIYTANFHDAPKSSLTKRDYIDYQLFDRRFRSSNREFRNNRPWR